MSRSGRRAAGRPGQVGARCRSCCDRHEDGMMASMPAMAASRHAGTAARGGVALVVSLAVLLWLSGVAVAQTSTSGAPAPSQAPAQPSSPQPAPALALRQLVLPFESA